MGWVFRNTGQAHLPSPYHLGPTPPSCSLLSHRWGCRRTLLWLGFLALSAWVEGAGCKCVGGRVGPVCSANCVGVQKRKLSSIYQWWLSRLIPSALLCEVPKALCRPRQAEGVKEPTWKEALRLFAERLGSLLTSYIISRVRKGCFSFSFLMDYFLEQFLFHGKK